MHRYTLFLHSCSCTDICRFAYLQICRYALYTVDRHAVAVKPARSYLLPLGKCSPAQGICKTAFLKHPRRFWLQKGHGAWLTEVFLPFQDSFFSPKWSGVQLLRVLPSYLSSWIGFLGSWGKTKLRGLGTAGNCGKAAHFMIHETVSTVFLLSQPSKSQFSFVVKTN